MHVFTSGKPLNKLLIAFLVLVISIFAIYNSIFVILSLLPQYIFQRDFLQEYLIARAALIGENPYLSITDLTYKFFGPINTPLLAHPTPHPPPVVLISLPFGFLPYTIAANSWLFIQLICIGISIHLLLRYSVNRSSWWMISLSLFFLLSLGFVIDELIFRQLNSVLLLLLILSWLSLKSGKDWGGGIFLGCAIALKLFAWPIILFFFFKNHWKASISAGITWLCANSLAGLIIGFDKVAYYYLIVSKDLENLYHADIANISLWSIGWRIFSGTGTTANNGIKAIPLYSLPAIAPYISVLILLIILILGFYSAYKCKDFDLAFGIMICVSVLISPLSWLSYLLLMLIPVAIIGRHLIFEEDPKFNWVPALALVAGIFILRRYEIYSMIQILAGYSPQSSLNILVPFWPTLPSLLPTLAVLILLILLIKFDSYRIFQHKYG